MPAVRRLFAVCLLTAIAAVVSPCVAAAGDIFPDEALEAVIKEVLRKQGKEEIKEEDLKNVFQVAAKKKGIKSLAGLEKCTSLVLIDVAGNEIEDLAPLAGLKDLQSVDLSSNRLKGVAALKDLVKIQYLQLEGNEITDLEPLQGIKALQALYLSGNKVASLEPIKDLPKLSSLYLEGNQISDLKPVAGLKWLANLNLKGNRVEDVAPLSGLTELRFTFLQDNQIKDFAPLIEMARKDAEGDRRFAPYWKLYLKGNPIDAGKRDQQIAELKKIGVRVNWQPAK
jgi:internalin A